MTRTGVQAASGPPRGPPGIPQPGVWHRGRARASVLWAGVAVRQGVPRGATVRWVLPMCMTCVPQGECHRVASSHSRHPQGTAVMRVGSGAEAPCGRLTHQPSRVTAGAGRAGRCPHAHFSHDERVTATAGEAVRSPAALNRMQVLPAFPSGSEATGLVHRGEHVTPPPRGASRPQTTQLLQLAWPGGAGPVAQVS